MTNSFVLTPTKLVSVKPDGKNAVGVVAFRDYKGEAHLLDFTAYGETGEKLLKTPAGSKFDAEGSLKVIKTEAKGNVAYFDISRVSAFKTPEGEEQGKVVEQVQTTPVEAIAPKATKSATPKAATSDDTDFDSIPF